jgi:uncharacterized heparinase superfamily protein
MLERSFEADGRVPGRLQRRLRRLLGMSPAEIASRTAERVRIEGDRRRYRHARPSPVSSAARWVAKHGSFKSYLRDVMTPRFLLAPDAGAGVTAADTTFRDAHAIDGEALLGHRVPLLGFGIVDLGPTLDWHRDPVAGERWALRFFADYDLVNGDGPDPKVALELNRHGHLPLLARAYVTTHDERYAREAVSQMLSWIDQNPVGWGLHWNSSLELALRSIAWLTTLALLAPSASLDDASAGRVGASLADQLEHIRKYPSLYTSPNTHLIGEAAALFIGGTALAEVPGAPRWRAAGARFLEGELERQVGADGFYGELSSYYHAYALEMYLLALVAGRRSTPLSPRVEERVERMADTLAALARPDGSLPLLADDDGGCTFTLGGLHYYDVRALLSCAAACFQRPDLFHAEAAERATWIFGRAAVAELERQAIARPRAGAAPRAWRDAGYAMQVMSGAGGPSRLLFDGGGMGIAGAGHGHADALQVLLDVGGRPVLVDPGTCVYNRAPEWRRHFRSTAAHNTVSVDGLDQSVAWGTFAWGETAAVLAGEPAFGEGWQLAHAAHDGYERLRGAVHHARHVLAVADDYWLIADVLTGRGDHRYAWHYQFAAEMAVAFERGDDGARASASDGVVRAGLTFAASVPVHARIAVGETSPLQGWVSSGYGQRQPAPVLEAAAPGGAPVVALTTLRPGGGPLGLDVERRPGCLVAHVTRGEVVDSVVVNGTGAPVVTGDVELDGELLWLRRTRDGGRVVRFVASRARWVRAGQVVRTGSGLMSFQE